jgi:hypothetical protein
VSTQAATGGGSPPARSVLLAVGVGGVTVTAIACAQVVAWAQVAVGHEYPSVDLLLSLGLWGQVVGLALASSPWLRIDARRSGVLLLVAALAFGVLALHPSPWLAALAVTAGAVVAVQGGTTRGELARVSGLAPGRAQAIVSGVCAFGLAVAVGALAALADVGVSWLFGTLAVMVAAAAVWIIAVFRPAAQDAPRSLVRVRRRLMRPNGPAVRGYALSALSSATTTSLLTPLASALEAHGFGGPGWLALSWLGSLPAALVLGLWSVHADRRSDHGAVPAAVLQLAGAGLALVALLDGSHYAWWICAGLLVLNVGRFGFDAAIFALRPGPRTGAALMLSAALGSAAFGTVAQLTMRHGFPHLWVTVFVAAVCLLVARARPLTVAPATT